MSRDSDRSGEAPSRRSVSRGALLVGAAGLLLFIVGVKRRHRLDAERASDTGHDDRG